MNNLASEFSNMDFGGVTAWLLKQGVSVRTTNICGGVAACNAYIDGDYFLPDSSGDKRLIVMPVYDGPIPSLDNQLDDDEIFLADLIAWEHTNPARWYFRRKEAGLVLGKTALDFELLWRLELDKSPPLTVFATPYDWLRAGGKGVCPLDAIAERKLIGLNNLFCPDIDFAQKLDVRLRLPQSNIPQILIPKMEAHIVHA